MASIRIDANATKAIQEMAKLINAQQGVEDGQDSIAGKSREAAAEERRLGSLRRRLMRDTNTAQETYQQKLGDAQRALKGVEGEERRLGQIRAQLSDAYEEELRQQGEGLDEVEDKLGAVEKASDETFDIGQITRWGGGILGAAGVMSKLLDTIRDVREEANAAGDALTEIVDSSGSLVQLAGDDATLRDKLFRASDKAFASGFVADRTTAEDLIFELRAGGRLDEADFFTRVGAIDDPVALAKAASVVEAAFRGSGEDVGSGRDLVSKGLAAAGPVSGVNASDVLEAVAGVSAVATQFGLSDEELFAGVSLVASQTGKASEAETQIRSLLSQLARRGLADDLNGKGFAAILAGAREAAGPTAKEQIEFLGGSEAARAFRPLEDPNQLRARLAAIYEGEANQLSERTIDNALGSERITATIARRAAEARDTLAQDENAINELLSDARQARFRTENRERFGDYIASFRDTARSTIRFLPGADADYANQERQFLNEEGLGVRVDRLLEATERQVKAAEQTTEAIKNQSLSIPTR